MKTAVTNLPNPMWGKPTRLSVYPTHCADAQVSTRVEIDDDGNNSAAGRVWWRVTTTTAVGSKISEFVDWYYGPTAEIACELAREDAHRYGLPANATFLARLATAEESRICETSA